MFRGRIPEPGEPLWTDRDRDEAMALVVAEWDACTGCGQSLTETTQPENEGRYVAEQLLCGGCRAQQVAAEQKPYPGRLIRVKPKG